MAGIAPDGTQFDTKHFDSKMNEILDANQYEFFTSYDEVHDSFDAMGLQENLLRGIYAYGNADSAREDFINDVRQFDVIMQRLLDGDDNGGVFVYDHGIDRHESMGLREDLMRQVFGLGEEEKPHKRRYESFKKRRAIDDSKWRMDPRVRLRKQPTWRYG